MSLLEWRNVDAPQVSLQGLYQGTQGLTNAFDRLAGAFFTREEEAKKEANSNAIAPGLALQDAKSIQDYIANNIGKLDPRVDKVAWANALNAHINQAVDTQSKNETLQNQLAKNAFGDLMGEYYTAANSRSQSAMDAVVAKAKERNPDFWNRVGADTIFQGLGILDTSEKRFEQNRSALANEAVANRNADNGAVSAQASMINARSSAAQARQNMELQREEWRMRKDTLNAFHAGQQFGGGLPQNTSAEDVKALLSRNPLYTNGTQAVRAAMESGAMAGFSDKTAVTSEDLLRPGSIMLPGSKGANGWSLMGNSPKAPSLVRVPVESQQYYNADSTKYLTSGKNTLAEVQDRFMRSHPNYAIAAGVGKYKDTTYDQALAAMKKTGVYDAKGYLDSAIAKNITIPEVMSMIDRHGFQDGSFWGNNDPFKEGGGYFQGGENQFNQVTNDYLKARQKGWANEETLYNNTNTIFDQRMKALERATKSMEQERAGGGNVSMKTLVQYNSARQAVNDLLGQYRVSNPAKK